MNVTKFTATLFLLAATYTRMDAGNPIAGHPLELTPVNVGQQFHGAASMDANSQLLARADTAFFSHDWVKALSLYKNSNIKGLSVPSRSLYAYREMFCLIRTGHYDEARRLLPEIKGKDYRNVRYFYTGYLDYIDGNFNRAYDNFSKVTPGISGLEAGYYMLQIEYSRGEYENVTARADNMLYRNPVPELAAEIHRINGLSYFKLGNYDVARISLQNYLLQNKGATDPDALYALGAIEYAAGDYSKAEEYFTPVTEEKGDVGQSAWLYLGQCRMMEDDIRGATLAFEKAAAYETDPAVARTALYNYITALTKGGSVPFSSSSKMLENFVERWPGSPQAEAVEEYLATSYFNDRNYKAAIDRIDKIHNPSNALLQLKQKALYEQGVREAANGNVKGSATWFEKASSMGKVDSNLATQALLWLGDARYAAGNFKQAEKDYALFVKQAKPSANRTLGYYDLGYAQFQLGRYKDAVASFARALDCTPAMPKKLADDARIRRADCLYYTRDYSGAALLYSEAINAGAQESDYATYRQAVVTGMSEGPREKISALDTFIRNFPDSRWVSDALLEKALTHEELGEAQLASEAYRKRMSITPNVSLDELMNMARTMDISGEAPDEQIKILDRIRNLGGLSADELDDIDLYQANALARLGKDSDADRIYIQLSKHPEALSGAIAAVTLADRMNARQEFGEANEFMTEFTELGTPHSYWLARAFIALADANAGMDKKQLAREYLISLRDNYPGNESDIFSSIDERLKKWK